MGLSADDEGFPSESLTRRALASFDRSPALAPEAPHSCHLVLVSEADDGHASGASRFVRHGLAAGERVLYLAGERDGATVEDAMRAGGIDADAHVDSGALTVLSTTGSGLPDDPAPEAVLDRIERTAATDAGEYDAVRVVTEVSRVFDGDPDAAADYEQGLSSLCENEPVIALCGYRRDRFPAEFLRDAIRAHPLVVTDGSVARNGYYTPPSVVWNGDSPERTVDRMLDTLGSSATGRADDHRLSGPHLRSALSAGGIRLLGVDHEHGTVAVRSLPSESLFGDEDPEDLPLDTVLQYVHPDDRERVARTFRSPEPGTDWSVEFRVVGTDDGERWVSADGEHVRDGDRTRSLGVLRDATEQKRLQRELRTEREHFRVALANSPFTAFRLDTDLRYTWIGNPHADFDESAVLGKRDDELLPPGPAAEIMAPKRRALETGEGVREEITYELPSGTVTYDLTVEPLRDDAGEVVGLTAAAMDLSDRKRLERMLSRLHEASRDLVRADSVADAAERTADAAVAALAIDTVAVYHFDETDNRLRRAATTPALAERCDASPTLASSVQSVAWESFLDGETVVRDDLADADTDGSFQSGLWIPLGDHGVLAVLSPDGPLDERVRQAADHLAATAEATLDRVDHADTLRAQERALAAKTRRLDRLRRLNDTVRDIDRALIGASTTAEIAEAVCERLTGADRFRFAWVGERTGPSVTPRAWAGAVPGYLDQVSLSTDADTLEPAARTAVTGAVTHADNVADDLRAEPWRRRALSHGLQSALSVPVQYDGVQYGVLTVYTDAPGALDPLSRDVLAELGDTIGNAMNAAETRQALHSDSLVELRLTIEDSDDPLTRLTTAADATIEVTGTVPKEGNRTRVFATVAGVDADTFERAAEDIVAIPEVARLDESSEPRYALVVLGQTTPATLVTLGAVARSITIADGTADAVIELPKSLSVRTFVDRLEATDVTVDLRARRETQPPDTGGQAFEALLTDEMTDRQREVLKTAYLSGYFEWPRERTGEEVAGSLDITQSTFNNHLRTAERKLLSRLFD